MEDVHQLQSEGQRVLCGCRKSSSGGAGTELLLQLIISSAGAKHLVISTAVFFECLLELWFGV